MTVDIAYRLLTADDMPAFAVLSAEMLAFHATPLPMPVEDLTNKLISDGPGGDEKFAVIGAFHDSDLVAFVQYSTVYETAYAEDCVFVRDLFVRQEFRRMGLGRSLMIRLATVCEERGWRRIDWHADRLDFDARTFYDMVCPDSFKLDRLSYRIENEQIKNLADLPEEQSPD